MSSEYLQAWGWPPGSCSAGASCKSSEPAPESAQDVESGRILREERRRLHVMTERGARLAAHRGADFCAVGGTLAVGDWVQLTRDEQATDLAQVRHRLPRANELVRQTKAGTQTIAANVDHAWLLVDASREPNAAALERYLIAIEAAGAKPALIISKIDLEQEWQSMRLELTDRFPDVPVLGVSALRAVGTDTLSEHMHRRATYCLLGKSGSGKSTLLNALAEREVARTGEVRTRDRKGRHVTTHRQLFRLPNDALMLDMPGMREFVPVAEAGEAPKRFLVIRELAEDCRFGDCRHHLEPGCAVQKALREGRLPKSLLDNYHRFNEARSRRFREPCRNQSGAG